MRHGSPAAGPWKTGVEMKVTVRRADRYVRAAIDAAKKFSLKAAESISIHDALLRGDNDGRPPSALLDRINKLARENTDALQTAVGLIETAYAIRQQIAEANLHHGISAILTREQEMKLKETILTAMLGQLADTGEEAETAITKATHVRTNPPTSRDLYGEVRDRISVMVPHADFRTDIETHLRKLKSDQVAANERRNFLNVTVHIELDSKAVDTLRMAHIIES